MNPSLLLALTHDLVTYVLIMILFAVMNFLIMYSPTSLPLL